jgi:hypothetical protein
MILEYFPVHKIIPEECGEEERFSLLVIDKGNKLANGLHTRVTRSLLLRIIFPGETYLLQALALH